MSFQQFCFGRNEEDGLVPDPDFHSYLVGPAAPEGDYLEGLRQLVCGEVQMLVHITDGSAGDAATLDGEGQVRINDCHWYEYEDALGGVPHKHGSGEVIFKRADLMSHFGLSPSRL